MKDFIFIHIPKCAGTSIRKSLEIERVGHCPARRTNLQNELVFSFVRNPFNRLASFYRFLYKRNMYRLKSDDIPFQDWFYLTLVNEEHPHFYNPEYWKPCYWWLIRDNQILADFVGKVETIEEDWNRLCELLGKNVILEKHNTTTNKGEQDYTPEMKEIVHEHFQKDFELWY